MTSAQYPALYRSSDELAAEYQSAFLRAIRGELLLLVLGTALSAVPTPGTAIAVLQALTLLSALALSVYLLAVRPDRYWYAARAVAESIKTATWRFISRAEPFNGPTDEDRGRFRNLLRQIIDQNHDVAKRLSKYLDASQMTEAMIQFREDDFLDRLTRYLKGRIGDQLSWYAKKAAWNRKRATGFFVAIVMANFLAVLFAILRVRFPNASYWPTDTMIAIAVGLLAWLQSKRFSDLAASYALAAHEISLIKEQAATINSETDFSRFVGDAENAFSREHTQWVARKDE